jgi:hypothetical protein
MAMRNTGGFRLPKPFLQQLGEFTRGYYLAVVNERGDIESFESYDNPAMRLAIVNFVDAQASAMQEHLRNQALRMEEETEQAAEDDDEDEIG